jgi:alkylated DNA repair dioxygenase AlkB
MRAWLIPPCKRQKTTSPEEVKSVDQASPGVEGLVIHRKFVLPKHDEVLCASVATRCHQCHLSQISTLPWTRSLGRLTQHYGAEYLYNPSHHLAKSKKNVLGWTDTMKYFQGVFSEMFGESFDQAIVNQYRPSQKIAPHIDSPGCFGPTIVTLSLGSPMVMRMSRAGQDVDILLEGGDVVVLRGPARDAWRHSLLPDPSADFLRVSVTFRTVNPDAPLA